MCGRYTIFTEAENIEMNAIIAEVSSRFGGLSVATGEVFPTNLAPVLWIEATDPVSKLVPKLARWGFPRWDGKGVVINARAETALTKSLFRKPLRESRCVIPSTGFYEWRHVPGAPKKEKYLCRLPDSDMLYIAGMTGLFSYPSGGEYYESYCVLTTAANESVQPIHDRMPVILERYELEAWLTDDAFLSQALSRVGPELVLAAVA